jgi:hypothetical protein
MSEKEPVRVISSQEEWERFEEEESLAVEFTDEWKQQIKEFAKRGRISIDLDKLNPVDRYKASRLLNTLASEINELETGNIYGYSNAWKAFVYLMFVPSILYSIITVVME